MKCAAVTTTNPDVVSAIDGLCDKLRADLDGHDPHMVVAFFTPHHTGDAPVLRERLLARLRPAVLLGCPGEGVIGGTVEIESQAGLSLWGAHWPGAELVPFRLTVSDVDGEPVLSGWPDQLPTGAGLVLLGDPYTTPADALLEGLSERFPGTPAVGGMASGASGPGNAQLITEEGVHDEGCVGVAIGGSVRLGTVVSQGCRPVGRHFVVTKANRNVIFTLGGKPAFSQLKAMLGQVEAKDRALIQKGAIHIGRVVDERKSSFGRSDLIVRNVMGIDPKSEAIAISDIVRPGQTVQFMVRDAESASEDLEALLSAEKAQGPPLGALLFSCNGRGTRLFGRPHHDIESLHQGVGQVPTAGFFCAGEIGPVGGHPFLHGFTASIALFRARP